MYIKPGVVHNEKIKILHISSKDHISPIHDFHNGGSLGRNGNYKHQSEARKASSVVHFQHGNCDGSM